MLPAAPPDWANDPPTRQQYLESLQGYYAYRREAYKHRQGDFWWQHISTIVIFACVLVLVFSGIYFAYVQFHAGLRRKLAPPPATDKKGEPRPATTPAADDRSDVEISWKGLRVSSSVLGVVILLISLGFFYLYLLYVYPISDTF